ncbi:hypothetical protein ACFVQ4_15475 [Streptomyces laurentii]|uniref:hypothetical protein n=1 Tax=Streptomyces laurentii TaxID=39478 RepID=UPI00369FE171
MESTDATGATERGPDHGPEPGEHTPEYGPAAGEPTRLVSGARATSAYAPEAATARTGGPGSTDGADDPDGTDGTDAATKANEADFLPTHIVPRTGLSAWEAPDPALPTEPLDAFLPVRLLDRVGDWGQVLCSNGWSAWVDARLLVSVPADPPAAGSPLTRTADPRPLIGRAADALTRYRRAAEELAAGRADGETFRRRTRGLRVGMVVDGESLWLYDAEHERWVYCDGTGLSTYAASAPPSSEASPPEPEPVIEPTPEPEPETETETEPEPEPGPRPEPEPETRAEPADDPADEPTTVREPAPGPVGHEPTRVVQEPRPGDPGERG